MLYAHVQLSTGAILAIAPLPRELVGLAPESLISIDHATNPNPGAGVDPCPAKFLDRGYLNRASLTPEQEAMLTAEQLASLVA